MTTRSSTSTNISEGSGTTITGTMPSGTSSGDRLLVFIAQDTATIISPPSGQGFTNRVDLVNTGPDGQTSVFFEKINATGGESLAFTSNSSKRAIIQVKALSGRHSSTASTVSTATINNSANAEPITVALTGLTAVSSDDITWFAQLDQSNQTATFSWGSLSGYVQHQSSSNSDWISMACYGMDNATAGATGTLTVLASAIVGAGSATAGYSGVVVATPVSSGTTSDPAASTSRFTSSRHTFGIRR